MTDLNHATLGTSLLQDIELIPSSHKRLQQVGSPDFQPFVAKPVITPAAGGPAPVMCNIVLHGFKMLHRRTNHIITGGGTDTVHLAPALNVDGVTYTVNEHNCGDLGDTSRWYILNYGFKNVPILPTSKIAFTFTITNAGHPSSSDIQKALDKVNNALLAWAAKTGEAGAKSGDYWSVLEAGGVAIIAEALQYLESLIFANCDGIVAANRYDLTGSDVLGPGGWSSMIIYPGVDSPSGCGANSKYAVACYVQRLDALATVNDTLHANQTFPLGGHLYSANHDFRLDMQTDGNLVVYSTRIPSFPLWASQTNGKPATKCIMQTDGNLVIYNGAHANFSTNTQGHPGAYAVMQNDGNFVIYQGGSARWSSKTSLAL